MQIKKFKSKFCFPIDMCINSVKETCFSQKYEKWICLILELNSSIIDTVVYSYMCLFSAGTRVQCAGFHSQGPGGVWQACNHAGRCQECLTILCKSGQIKIVSMFVHFSMFVYFCCFCVVHMVWWFLFDWDFEFKSYLKSINTFMSYIKLLLFYMAYLVLMICNNKKYEWNVTWI